MSLHAFQSEPSVVPPVHLVHADDALLVVLKPAGQLSVPGKGALAEGSLAGQVQARWPDAKVVHRLDMATSGLLLFGRGVAWQRVLSRMFAERQVAKRYVAVVHGRLGHQVGASGEIDLPLAADWPHRPRQHVDAAHGKPSLTRWQVLAHDPAGAWTRAALSPVTGRSHQLRVHLLAIGHPILGDALYGVGMAASASPRMLLHAESLSFRHPATGNALTVFAPAPF